MKRLLARSRCAPSRSRRTQRHGSSAGALLLAVCASACSSGPAAGGPSGWNVTPDVPISAAPYDIVHTSWKQRLDEAYVFVEHLGDYRAIGATIARLLTEAQSQGVVPTGPMFCLFYDDPGRVPIDRLRARACLPVQGAQRIGAPLGYDVLPGQPVVYAVVAGAYQEVPRAYPGLLGYLAERGWVEDGPWREIYLNPEQAERPDELLTEVQVPWTVR